MVDLDALRAMSPDERHELKRALAQLDDPHPFEDPRLVRRRHVGLTFGTAACAFLVVWIGVLAVTLPHEYQAKNWTAAWSGFDVLLFAGLAATSVAGWRRRQIMIFFSIATATLLLCDAWFDITLAWGRPDVWTSVLTAVFGELPTAAFLLTGVHRVLTTTLQVARIRAGLPAPHPPLHKVPLFTTDW